jgi:hypothetical protein
MQRATQRARWEFIHLMMKHATITPANVDADNTEIITEGDVQRAALKLLRYGATLGRIAEFECNAPDARYGQDEYNARMQRLWEREQERLERKEARIVARVHAVCASIGCKAILQGDPRGNTLKIVVPDGYTNDWGREGIGVPTS